MTREDDELQSLFAGVEPRRSPPETARARAFAETHAAWQETLSSSRRSRRRWLASAAAVALAVLIGLQLPEGPDAFVVDVADAAALDIDGRRFDPTPLQGGSEVRIESGVEMRANEPARLSLGKATDVRLDATTTIRWLAADAFELVAGTVFVNTRGEERMSVHSSRGVVSDIGTQFLVSLRDGVLEVAMREGETRLDTELGVFHARAADQLGDIVRVSPSEVRSEVAATSDDRWQWIHSVHPEYTSDRVLALLQQIAADQGKRLEFADPGTRAAVMNMQLHGDLTGLAGPRAVLDVVLATSHLALADETPQALVVTVQ